MVRMMGVLLAASALAACATGQAAPDPAAKLAAEDPDALVCRYEQVTGQHRRERVCMTASRRAELREATQSGLISRSGENPNRATGKGDGPFGPKTP